MDYSTEHTLTIRFSDEEVDLFLGFIDSCSKELQKPGFKKVIPKEYHSFINGIHEDLIGEDGN